MIVAIFFIVLFVVCFLVIKKKADERDAMHAETSEAIMRPLLTKTFGNCYYDPNGRFTDSDLCGAFWGHNNPDGHDLVDTTYRGVHTRFNIVTLRDVLDPERDNTPTVIFKGPWIILDKPSPVTKRVYVLQKTRSDKGCVATGDQYFDAACSVMGDANEVMTLLDQNRKTRILSMIQKHPQAMFVFESSRIHIAYNEGETFMPSKQYDSNQLFNMQFNDFMDLLNEAIEL